MCSDNQPGLIDAREEMGPERVQIGRVPIARAGPLTNARSELPGLVPREEIAPGVRNLLAAGRGGCEGGGARAHKSRPIAAQ